MSRINKTQNNLQSVWNNLDLAYEHMERAIEDLSQMTGLSDELEKMVEQYDLSEISIMKQEVEELMLNADINELARKDNFTNDKQYNSGLRLIKEMGYRYVSENLMLSIIVCVMGTKNLLENWKR